MQDQHDKAGFTSGVAELDRYLHTQAGQDAKRNVAAPFVSVEHGSVVIGYYTLSAYGIRLSDLSAKATKKLPKYPVLSATLLGRLAVSTKRQGQKLEQLILMDALDRSLKNTREIGSIGVIVDAYDENAERFYRHHEFTSLPVKTENYFWLWLRLKSYFPRDPAALDLSIRRYWISGKTT